MSGIDVGVVVRNDRLQPNRVGTPGFVDFVEVDDEHRLSSLLEGDVLSTLVRRALLVPR